MSTYLIDFENVKSGGLAGIDRIRKGDSVHLFWSARENKISIEMMELIRSSESEIVMHKAVTGERDALDHQLCSYLGFLAGGKGETDFVIVSNDKAYDHLIEFWRMLNAEIHIQRVPEISKVSEVPVLETVLSVLPAAPEEKMIRVNRDETGTLELEHPVPDTFSARGSRRRERGSKYLKGSRSGRVVRKYNYAEERPEEEAETAKETGRVKDAEAAKETGGVKKAEAAKETGGVKKAEAAKETGRVKEAEAVKETDEVKDANGYPVEHRVKESAAAYVVTGIKTGILVESGFTADGILGNRSNLRENRKEENDGTELREPERVTAEKPAENEKPEHAAAEKPSENEKPEHAAAEKPSENEKPEHVTAEKPEENKPENLPGEQTTGENSLKGNGVEASLNGPAKKKDEEAEKMNPEEKTEKITAENVEAEPSAQEKESDLRESGETEKKNRSRTVRAGSKKRGRPPKKEHTEHFPEIKAPVIESDVIAKYDEAAGAEWTGEVVRLINSSRDKKELYSAIVKLLGQEKGRTVYHAIKVLK